MDDCLFKPLQLPQLEAILSDVMKSKQAALAEPAGLDKLVNIEKLKTMSSHDGGMLGELLRLTLQSNEEDLRLAEDLFSLQDWPELASCAHRISGAVQICGAERAENACRNLEVACREAVVDEVEIEDVWLKCSSAVGEFNQAIYAWLNDEEFSR